MIAPLKESTLDDRAAASWAGARRAVAALLLKPAADNAHKLAAPVARRTTWFFVAWAVAVAVLYLTRGAWWIDPAP
jgi:hypothetical protein